jgi:hypothetical protein
MIVYPLVGQHLGIKALHSLLHYAEHRSMVDVALKNRLAPVAAGGGVVDRIRELDPLGGRVMWRRIAGVGGKARPNTGFPFFAQAMPPVYGIACPPLSRDRLRTCTLSSG